MGTYRTVQYDADDCSSSSSDDHRKKYYSNRTVLVLRIYYATDQDDDCTVALPIILYLPRYYEIDDHKASIIGISAQRINAEYQCSALIPAAVMMTMMMKIP